MARSAEITATRIRTEPSSVARLRLLESILAAGGASSACQCVLDWLHEHANVRTGLAAVLGADETLEGVAAVGSAQSRALSIRVDARDRSHPLVAPLQVNDVVHVPGGARHTTRVHGLERGAHVIMPIWGSVRGDKPGPLGLFVLNDVRGNDLRIARWAVGALAPRLAAFHCEAARERAEQRARRSHALLESIIDAVPDPVVLSDSDGNTIVSNPRAQGLFESHETDSDGRRHAVSLNRTLFSSTLVPRANDTREELRREVLLVDPNDGSDLLFELMSASTPDGTRRGVHTVSILRNVTDLRRATQEIEANLRKLRLAEADVRAERDRLDLIIDSVADPILVTDPSGEIVLMNVPAEHLFTVASTNERDDAIELVHANETHFTAFVSNVLFADHATRWRGELALIDPASTKPMPVEAIAGKLTGDQGEVIAVVTILHDRTEAIENARLYAQLKEASGELERKVRQATAELVRQNELLQRQAFELEQASNLKSQFLANVSHEFRTPLNAILGYTSMLLQGVSGQVPASCMKHLQRVDSNARHLLAIINDILDIARIESGRMPLNVGEFALAELVGEVLAELEPIIQRSHIEVDCNPEESVPQLRTDRQKLKQIVLNLLSNALKFTHDGSIRVAVSHDATSDRIQVAVTDTGIGIDPRHHEKIFEDFQQADNSTTRQYGGTGLGLSICRRLARMLGGDISLTSELGKGSTFMLTIPRRLRKK